jgi:hypothetical protein
MVFGGTSVAAPLVGGLYGYYGVPMPTGTQPFAGYAVANAWSNSGALFDVTSGSNGRCTRGKTGVAKWCNGAVGYDGPTGWGTPNSSSAPF